MPTEENKIWRKSNRATILGIAGATNSGKTTLATELKDEVRKTYVFADF